MINSSLGMFVCQHFHQCRSMLSHLHKHSMFGLHQKTTSNPPENVHLPHYQDELLWLPNTAGTRCGYRKDTDFIHNSEVLDTIQHNTNFEVYVHHRKIVEHRIPLSEKTRIQKQALAAAQELRNGLLRKRDGKKCPLLQFHSNEVAICLNMVSSLVWS